MSASEGERRGANYVFVCCYFSRQGMSNGKWVFAHCSVMEDESTGMETGSLCRSCVKTAFFTASARPATENPGLQRGAQVLHSFILTPHGPPNLVSAPRFYGGFVFLEERASLSCQGATVIDNTAGDQGGAIYARDANWVHSSCDLIGNGAPQGSAVYLTSTFQVAHFEKHTITDGSAAGVSMVYAVETSIFAEEVAFQSDADLQDVSSGPAVQLESNSTLVANGCIFSGWTGDVVVQSTNPTSGSLVLDSCDFSPSSATMMVSSPNSDAEIRNAFVGNLTVENAAVVNGTFFLVDRTITCDDPGACGAGGCVGSALGVLCECLEGGECVDGGGALSVMLETPPPNVTYYPDSVDFELQISAAVEGTTSAIWVLTVEAENLTVQMLPSSGILPPGEDVTVNVIGSPMQQDVGGEQEFRFVVSSVSSGTSDSITVGADFYVCRAFEYATVDDDGDFTCEQCVVLSGAEGVDCELPGATLGSLPIRRGYWRSSNESLVIHSCLHFSACAGATRVLSSDDYCQEGYSGPCKCKRIRLC